MLRRILLPLAKDPSSAAATDVALHLARLYHAGVTSLTIADLGKILAAATGPGFSAAHLTYSTLLELQLQQSEQSERLTAEFLERASKAHVRHREQSRDGSSWICLSEESALHDLVVIGRHAHFAFGDESKEGVGTTLRRTLDHAKCPVLCVSKPLRSPQRILIGIDGRDTSLRALTQFIQLGIFMDAELLVTYFEEHGTCRDVLDDVRDYLVAHQRWVRLVRRDGSSAKSLPALADELSAEMVVVGAHGKSRVAEWVLGSTTKTLLHDTDLAVLVVN